jgi:hypothetical protein
MKSLLMIDKITAMLFFSGYGIFLLITSPLITTIKLKRTSFPIRSA